MNISSWMLLAQTVVLAATLIAILIQMGLFLKQVALAQNTDRARFQPEILLGLNQTRLELLNRVPDLHAESSSGGRGIQAAGGSERYLGIRFAIDHLSDAFHLRQQGYLDDATWGIVNSGTLTLMSSPIFAAVWRELASASGRFFPGFADYIEGVEPEILLEA